MPSLLASYVMEGLGVKPCSSPELRSWQRPGKMSKGPLLFPAPAAENSRDSHLVLTPPLLLRLRSLRLYLTAMPQGAKYSKHPVVPTGCAGLPYQGEALPGKQVRDTSTCTLLQLPVSSMQAQRVLSTLGTGRGGHSFFPGTFCSIINKHCGADSC